MLIAVEGCAHGELEKIYQCIEHLQKQNNVKVDLLICCGDFQSVRNSNDLCCMAIPPKFYNICTFYKYYSGEAVAPILTIFIGGNHEASNYLQELPYGGWVAPNIYYMGYAGVVTVAGIRIGGLSGIYKGHDYLKGHFEVTPYSDNTKRSVYHIRNLEVFRLRQLKDKLDIVISHDWPRGVAQHGDVNRLLKDKPFFAQEIEEDRLGSQPAAELLQQLRPAHWFSAHLHCKHAALVPHTGAPTHTKFLALDKCLPRRRFLQVLDIPHNSTLPIELHYDLDWLTVLHLTNHLLSVRTSMCHMPGEHGDQKYNFTPTDEEKKSVLKMMDGNLVVPHNFVMTAEPYDPEDKSTQKRQPQPVSNAQTTRLCDLLQIDDPVSLVLLQMGNTLSQHSPITPKMKSVHLTPENLAERTFSDLSDTTYSSPITPLSLPVPKKSFSEPILEMEKTSGIVYTIPSTPDCIINSEELIEETSAVTACSTPVSTKKPFKRRNESFYSNKPENE